MEGGSAKEAKQALRERIWRLMEAKGVARFPGAWGRIPNFVGSEEAALRVCEQEEWKKAGVIKSNPDSPQRPLRELALRRGKVVYMAVPRLRRERCFIRLDPTKLRGIEGLASTIRGAFRHGKLVAPWEMERIDLVVAGVVAVNEFGEKVGKSGGYTDLEFAIGREFGIIAGDTPVITTVHELQLVGEEIPQEKHDVSIDLVVTPKRVVRTKPRHPKPKGIYWDLLDEEKLRSIPILRRLAR